MGPLVMDRTWMCEGRFEAVETALPVAAQGLMMTRLLQLQRARL